jgi:hypothetical protein
MGNVQQLRHRHKPLRLMDDEVIVLGIGQVLSSYRASALGIGQVLSSIVKLQLFYTSGPSDI